MSDWFERITDLFSASEDNTPVNSQSPPSTHIPHFFSENDYLALSARKAKPTHPHPKPEIISPSEPVAEVTIMKKDNQQEENLKTLKRLRELPRGTQVDSRIAAIDSILGESEVFKTLKTLRWPQGVVCPKCRSSSVIRKDPPPQTNDKRNYYTCLVCQEQDGSGDFDDFTGLPMASIHALRQWILCWYLLGFCSVAQIAKVLGLSVNEVIQMANLGSELTQLPTAKDHMHIKAKKTSEEHAQKTIETQEEYTRSENKSPFKPGYKSKK